MQSATLWQLLQQVGWTMVPIYLLSIFVVAVAIRKLLDLRSARIEDTQWFEAVLRELREGRLDDARRRAETSRHLAGPVIAGTLRALDEQPEEADNEARRLGLEQVARLERNMSPLALAAEIAPLLGLLGTVIGMVELFMGIEGQQSGDMNMGLLSGGIWKALLTTAAGLTVAVPALAVHAYLGSRVQRFRNQLTSFVQRVRYAHGARGGEP